MNQNRTRRRLHNLNRFIVVALITVSVAIDGYLSIKDLIVAISAILWIYLDELNDVQMMSINKLTSMIKMVQLQDRKKYEKP